MTKKEKAQEYSFNTKSELFQTLTPEQQKMWRKEIEEAYLAGCWAGFIDG